MLDLELEKLMFIFLHSNLLNSIYYTFPLGKKLKINDYDCN